MLSEPCVIILDDRPSAADPHKRWFPTPRRLPPATSAHLDLIRAMAAWLVMWGHLRGNFFIEYQELRHPSLFLKGLYYVTGFGHQAVMVFFVLSGFLISASVISSHLSNAWSWRKYAINRASRLYVVLVPGLLLGFLWDKLGSNLFASTGLYLKELEGFGASIPQYQMTFSTFIGNLLFLQTIRYPVFGSNGPLWSLSNEFWYYVVFPIGLIAGIAWFKHSVRKAVPLTILSCGLLYLLGYYKAIGFVVWLSGCALVLAYSAFPFFRKSWLLVYGVFSFLLLGICLEAARMKGPVIFRSDLSVGIAFAFVLFGVLYWDFGARSAAYHNFARFCAGFSYSLYVLHFPVLLFLRGWIVPYQKWQPDMPHLAYGFVIGLLVLGYAWSISLFTEEKTHLVRNWLSEFVSGYQRTKPALSTTPD